jgi:ABC-type glycerol-3-phosphate transport system substrate-binding protein
LQGKKAPCSRFFGILCAKRNKLLGFFGLRSAGQILVILPAPSYRTSLIVKSTPEKQEAAFKFIKEYASRESQLERMCISGYLPIASDLAIIDE